MTSIRRSDENSNPDYESDVDEKNIKVENKVKPLPLVPTNEASTSKRRLSNFDRKEKQRFERSGMKKGSLLQYFVKDNPDEMHEPKISAKLRNRRNVSTSSANQGTHRTNRLSKDSRNGNALRENLTQDSDLECLGIAQREKKNREVIPVPSESGGSESVSKDCYDPESPQVSSYSDDEDMEGRDIEHSVNVSSSEDIEAAISTLDTHELSGEDKIERWQRQNKRLIQDEETGVSSSCADLEPPPSKSCKFESEEVTPEKNTPPAIRIVNVFTLRESESTPGTSSAAGSSVQFVETAKRSIYKYKEHANKCLELLISKKNWRKAIQIIRSDLEEHLLPDRSFITQLIQKPILCIDTRVSKDVQTESIKLLEDLIKLYPPQTGKGSDPSVKYYKEIFEKVFEDGGEESPLNRLITHIHDSLPTDKNGFQLLYLVTELVVNQFEVYGKGTGIKVSPPLFQYFLEPKDGVFAYNSYCKSIVEKCCKAESDEEFCLYMKWVNLLARKLGQYAARHRKDFSRMVEDFSELCSCKNDYGLQLIMNLTFKPFAKAVCEAIFRRLKVVHVTGDTSRRVLDTDRLQYLVHLSETCLIQPADQIIADVVEKECKSNGNLKIVQPRVHSASNDGFRADDHDRARKRNIKGETKLHVLCRPGYDSSPLEIKNYLQQYPNDVNAKDNFGNTPLHDCAKNDKGNVIAAMMDLYRRGKLRNIDFLARNESLETPLHLAAAYCSSSTIEILKYFAIECDVVDQVLTAANSSGELPFQLARSNPKLNKEQREANTLKLKPEGYDEGSVYLHNNLTLDKTSIDVIDSSFELRKILAWWYRNCRNA